MDLTEVIEEGMIIIDSDYETKEECLDVMIERLYNAEKIESKSVFLNAVHERENLCSTYCTMEMAIPHGISDTVKMSSLCFLRNKKTFDWDNDGETPVRFIFLIAVSDHNRTADNNEHLLILSKIATLTFEDGFMESLNDIKEAKQFLEVLKKYEREN